MFQHFHFIQISYITCLRSMKSKIDDYVIDLLCEEHELDSKSRQFWRLNTKKASFRSEKWDVENLRKKIANVAENLTEEIEFLERGYFKLTDRSCDTDNENESY